MINDTAEALVIKFAIRLESLGLEDSLLDLVVADIKAQFTGVLIEQRLVNQTVQHLLTHGLHVIFIGRQFRKLIAKLLLHAVTLLAAVRRLSIMV